MSRTRSHRSKPLPGDAMLIVDAWDSHGEVETVSKSLTDSRTRGTKTGQTAT